MVFITHDVNFFLNSIKLNNLTLIPDFSNTKYYLLGNLHNNSLFELNNRHQNILNTNRKPLSNKD